MHEHGENREAQEKIELLRRQTDRATGVGGTHGLVWLKMNMEL